MERTGICGRTDGRQADRQSSRLKGIFQKIIAKQFRRGDFMQHKDKR